MKTQFKKGTTRLLAVATRVGFEKPTEAGKQLKNIISKWAGTSSGS